MVEVVAGGFHFGGGHTCARVASGAVWCWGANTVGQLGNGQAGFGVFSATPVAVIGLDGPAIALAAGAVHTCAVLAGGAVRCWGSAEQGQLGDGKQGSGQKATKPTLVLGVPDAIRAVTAGDATTCVLSVSGAVFCWGGGAFGQFGVSPSGGGATTTPIAAFSGDAVLALAQGAKHGCVVRASGHVACAGLDDVGEIGVGTPGPFQLVQTPVEVSVVDALAIGTGASTTCALRKGGALSCWGDWLGVVPTVVSPP